MGWLKGRVSTVPGEICAAGVGALNGLPFCAMYHLFAVPFRDWRLSDTLLE